MMDEPDRESHSPLRTEDHMSLTEQKWLSASRASGIHALAPWSVDVLAWAGGLSAVVCARYGAAPTARHALDLATVIGLAVLLHTVLGHRLFLYRGRYGFGTFDEVRGLFVAVTGTAGALTALDLALPQQLTPVSAPLLGGPCALVLMLGVRMLRRLQRQRMLRPDV